MEKKTQVVMLPTNKASTRDKMILKSHISGKLMYEQIGITRNTTVETQHLYFLSDEDIKKGDWYVQGTLKQATKELEGHILYKVVASTDKSLKLFSAMSLNLETPIYNHPFPQINEAFQRVWVDEYNAGTPIEWVNLEYNIVYENSHQSDENGSHQNRHLELKLRADNTVIVRTIKQLFTREEMKAMYKATCERLTNSYLSYDIEWFDKNY